MKYRRIDMRATIVGATFIATLLVVIAEQLNRHVLRILQLYQDMLTAGTVWTVVLSLTALATLKQPFRRQWIGVILLLAGLVSFCTLDFIIVDPQLGPRDARARENTAWVLPVCYGLFFAGGAWLLAVWQLTYFLNRAAGEKQSDRGPALNGDGWVTDVFYVVFCRLHGIKKMASDQIASAVESLADVACQSTSQHSSIPFKSYSSVYGRLVVVPQQVSDALRVAKLLLHQSGERGIVLGIGVAVGRVESTQDLLDHNVAGAVINRAARLAHIESSEGRIAVDSSVYQDASKTSRTTQAELSEQLQGRVKRTEIHYHWYGDRFTQVGDYQSSNTQFDSKTAHVVVYDLVAFSELDPSQLAEIVALLRIAVNRSFEPMGGVNAVKFCYAPAGDGGVIVFPTGPQAWRFATSLLDQSRGKLRLRVGIDTGPVIVVKDNYPVGQAIIGADALSSLPDEGTICVSSRFWNDSLLPTDRGGWVARPHSGTSDALLLTPPTAHATQGENSDMRTQ